MIFFKQYTKSDNDFKTAFQQSKVLHVLADYSNPDLRFKNLAKECGIPLIYEEDPVTGDIAIDKWTEIKYEPALAKNSYKSSNKAQPLHTDYGYFAFEIYAAFFYCVQKAEFGGATTFIDVDTVVYILKSINPTLFQQIQKEKIHFGRKDNPLTNNDDFILQKDKLGWKINWNYYRASDDFNHKSLIEDFKAFLDNFIEKSGELTEIKLNPGEGVFFQDRRVLHGRNSFIGDRHLNKGGIALQIPEDIIQLLKLE